LRNFAVVLIYLQAMAMILNIETATEVCSVNLARNGKLLCEKESLEGLNHSRLLTVFIEEIFKENGYDPKQLDAVAVSKGPGSYTGLRIGVSVAKGMCYSLGIPLIAVGTLDALGEYTIQNRSNYLPSECLEEETLFCPMIDARRMEVYSKLTDSKGRELEPVSAQIIDENSFSLWLKNYKVIFFGNGSEKCRTALTHPNALFTGPQKASARFMIKAVQEKYKNQEFEDVAYFEPFYLKNFIATVPKNRITG
jgi:tRNA threonylcarbamoyladenosine biosynthesis protein TsaB